MLETSMPIQFRCPACERTLSIARRKAGTSVKCPQCAAMVMVPAMAGVAIETTEPANQKRLPVIQPEVVNKPNHAPSKVKSRANSQNATKEKVDSMPLFERPDFESLLNPALAQAKNESQRKARPEENATPAPIAPLAPIAVTSEPEPSPVAIDNHLMMSRRKLAMIAIAIAVLIGISFVAGYFLASATLPPKKPTNTEAMVS